MLLVAGHGDSSFFNLYKLANMERNIAGSEHAPNVASQRGHCPHDVIEAWISTCAGIDIVGIPAGGVLVGIPSLAGPSKQVKQK
jgi:hypothetical protein